MAITVKDKVQAPSPNQIETYLINHGWIKYEEIHGWTLFKKDDLELEVALTVKKDWETCCFFLFENLELLEKRPSRQIALEILAI